MAPSVDLPQETLAALAPAISAHIRANSRRGTSANDTPAAGTAETADENVEIRDADDATTSAPSATASTDATFAELLASVLGDGAGGYDLSALAWETAVQAEAAVAAGRSSEDAISDGPLSSAEQSVRSYEGSDEGDYAFLDGRPRGLALLEAAVTGPEEAAWRVAAGARVGPGG
jgi:hypothetical protein